VQPGLAGPVPRTHCRLSTGSADQRRLSFPRTGQTCRNSFPLGATRFSQGLAPADLPAAVSFDFSVDCNLVTITPAPNK